MENFSQALLEIYGAAVNPGRWRHALDRVSDASGARATMLRIRKPQGWSRDLQLLDSRYLAFAKSPAGIYYQARYSHLQRPDWGFLGARPALEPTWDLEAGYEAPALDKRGDYAYLTRRLDVRRRLGVRLNADRVWFDALSMGFADAEPRAPAHVATAVLPLIPHLSQAAEMSRLFLALRKKYAAVLAALDHVDLAMVILRPDRQVIVANTKAQELFAQDHGIHKSTSGQLELLRADPDRELAKAVRAAAETSHGEGNAARATLSVESASAGESLLLDVHPLQDAKREVDVSEPAALVTIVAPGSLPEVKLDRFARIYGLSDAERAVCELAFSALRVEEIAEQRGTSPVTAKNQIAAILGKTGVRSRLELMKLIISTHPPVI
ncbi:MAG: helix-turn-helix transcriptional regulator [Pseudomonadota bacterium]